MASLHLTLSLLILTLPPLALSSLPQEKQPIWIKPYIIDYQNGTVSRDTISNPPSFVNPPNTSLLQSKDITISLPTTRRRRHLRARVFLPARPDPARKLPILVYFHGGAFCIGSPFSEPDTAFLARVITAGAHVIALSLDYTLFPDDVIPAPYDEAWAFLKWAARPGPGSDPWVAQFGDLTRVFVGGDSAGGNIANNLAIRAGLPDSPVRLTGAFLAMPYFLGSGRVPMEPESISGSPNYKIWAYVCPGCKAGVDDPFINPGGPGAPSLGRLGCKRMLVYAAERDELYGRDLWYYERVKESGWAGQARFIEAKGKGHVFHILEPDDPATTKLIKDLSEFLNA